MDKKLVWSVVFACLIFSVAVGLFSVAYSIHHHTTVQLVISSAIHRLYSMPSLAKENENRYAVYSFINKLLKKAGALYESSDPTTTIKKSQKIPEDLAVAMKKELATLTDDELIALYRIQILGDEDVSPEITQKLPAFMKSIKMGY